MSVQIPSVGEAQKMDLPTLRAELEKIRPKVAASPSPLYEWKLKKVEAVLTEKEAKSGGGSGGGGITRSATAPKFTTSKTFSASPSQPKFGQPTSSASSLKTTSPTKSSSPSSSSSSSLSPSPSSSSSSSPSSSSLKPPSPSPIKTSSSFSSPSSPNRRGGNFSGRFDSPSSTTTSSSSLSPSPSSSSPSSPLSSGASPKRIAPSTPSSTTPSSSSTTTSSSSSSSSDKDGNICSRCNKKNAVKCKFCRGCGSKMVTPRAPTLVIERKKVESMTDCAKRISQMKERQKGCDAERQKRRTVRRTVMMSGLPKDSSTNVRRVGNIRTLDDVQAAIKEADNRKQNAHLAISQSKALRKEREEREKERVQSNAHLIDARRSRRATMRQNEFKVTSQLENFVQSMQILEKEFDRLSDELQKKDEALTTQIEITEKSEQQVELLSRLLENSSDGIEKMSEDLKQLLKTAPGKQDSPYLKGLQNFEERFNTLHRDLLVQVAKSETESKMIAESTVKLMEERGVPPPPPPPVVPIQKQRSGTFNKNTGGAQQAPAPRVTAVSALLSSIREGTKLRAVDQEKVKLERDASKKRWGQTVNMFASLQDTLLASLEERRQALDEDSEDDEEMEDDWYDEDDL